MANYKLVIKEKSNEYKEVDLKKLSYFKDKNPYKLEMLVDFTTNFDSIESLKLELYKNDLINKEEFNKGISVIYRSNGVIKKIKYGISLSEDKRFFDQFYLAYYINSKSNDINFLQKLCNNYRNSYYSNIIYSMQQYVDCLKYNNVTEQVLDKFYNTVKEFVMLITGKIDKKTGEYKIEYKQLRDLAMYISYLSKQNETKQQPTQSYEYDQLEIQEAYDTNLSQAEKINIEKEIYEQEQLEEEFKHNQFLHEIEQSSIDERNDLINDYNEKSNRMK